MLVLVSLGVVGVAGVGSGATVSAPRRAGRRLDRGDPGRRADRPAERRSHRRRDRGGEPRPHRAAPGEVQLGGRRRCRSGAPGTCDSRLARCRSSRGSGRPARRRAGWVHCSRCKRPITAVSNGSSDRSPRAPAPSTIPPRAPDAEPPLLGGRNWRAIARRSLGADVAVAQGVTDAPCGSPPGCATIGDLLVAPRRRDDRHPRRPGEVGHREGHRDRRRPPAAAELRRSGSGSSISSARPSTR